MNSIRFRSIVLIILLLISITIPVAGFTRIITTDSDNIYTTIWNTNGKYWEASGTNLQAAITDLGSNGGTVYVGSDITLSSALTVGSYSTVDFLGNTVTLDSDIHFVSITTAIRCATVRNAVVVVSSHHTVPVISIHHPAGGSWFRIESNCFENIYIKNPSPLNDKGEWTEYNYTGIRVRVETDGSTGGDIIVNRYENIYMEGCGIGIQLYSDGTHPNRHNISHFINGEYFKNIYMNQFRHAIQVNTTYSRLLSRNVFHNVLAVASSFSETGFTNMSRQFSFIGGVFDWDKAENPDILFSTMLMYRPVGAGSWDFTFDAYINWRTQFYDEYFIQEERPGDPPGEYDWNFLIVEGEVKWSRG